MERILSENERMRRAEEIYFRRNNRNVSFIQDKKVKQKNYFYSKVLFNLLVLFNIAVLVFCIQNKDFIFTKEFLQKCSQYNINIKDSFTLLVQNIIYDNSRTKSSFSNKIDENITNEANNINEAITHNQENIVNDSKEESEEKENAISSISEVDEDVQNLKNAYKFVNPLQSSIVSSGFGARESEYQNVKGYHTGIDLAAEKGTIINAAMEGLVTLVSEEGDYRKTFKSKM